MDTLVELEGVNGERFILAGPGEGDRGIHLGTDVKGLYDPPVKVVSEEPGNFPGSRYLNHRILKRDITFGVEILSDAAIGPNSWLSRESEWRKAWAFDRDCKLYITTPESGTRYLKLRLAESPEVSWYTDPRGRKINRTVMVCVAYDPFWYEDDVVYTAVTQTDTTFDPNPLPWPWPKEELPTETLTIEVEPGSVMANGKVNAGGLNPTDQPTWLKWLFPGSTEAPAEPYVPGVPWLGAPNSPAVIWTVPDYSFTDPEQENRRVRLPGLIGGLRTEELQAIHIDGRPTGGNWLLGFDGETTTTLPVDADENDVHAALVALAGIAYDDVEVQRAAATNEIQRVIVRGGATDGTFLLNFDGEWTDPIDFNASELELQIALSRLSNLGYFDFDVDIADEQDEIQLVRLIGEPTDGTFRLGFDGHWTDPIDWDASAFQMHDRLVALPNIDLLQVSVTKDIFDGPYAPWRIRFAGGLAGVDLNDFEYDVSGLSGGAGIDIEIENESEGYRVYDIEFRAGGLSGVNLPQMTGDASGLIGGVNNTIEVTTVQEGSRPFLVTFTGALAGVDVPTMTVDTSGLTGSGTITGYVKTQREGHTYAAENAVIDTDPREEQVASENGSQLWSRMNGVRFRHPVPPWTSSKTFEITVSGAVPGQMVVLRIPRAWTRPWGME